MTDAKNIRETLFAQFGELENKDQWWFVTQALSTLQKASKAPKAKKTTSDDKKREPNAWIKLTQYVRGILNTEAETDPVAKKPKAVTQVSKMLKDENKMDPHPSTEDVMDAYARWKVSHLSSASVESKEDKKTVAEKNKAIREAKKAAEKTAATASSASASAPRASLPLLPASTSTSPAPPSTPPMKVEDGIKAPPKIKRVIKKKAVALIKDGEKWEHDFGSGTVVYDRFKGPEANTYYIYDPKDGYVGLYNNAENELNADVPDPLLS